MPNDPNDFSNRFRNLLEDGTFHPKPPGIQTPEDCKRALNKLIREVRSANITVDKAREIRESIKAIYQIAREHDNEQRMTAMEQMLVRLRAKLEANRKDGLANSK